VRTGAHAPGRPGPWCIAALGLALLAPRPALAGEGRGGGVPAPPGDLRSDFWREVAQPGYAASRALFDQGLRLLAVALETRSPTSRTARLQAAIARLELAHRRAPDDPQALYYLGVAIAALEGPGLGRQHAEEEAAVTRFLELRALDPDFYSDRVAFELGILYTRMGRLAQAADEYRRAIERAFDEAETVSAHSNLAEVCMLAGDLELAVAHYDRAIELARRGGASQSESLALALFGSAVALHRLGQREAAIERARQALSAGGGSMDVLRAEGVFFEPIYEIHYYEALGHLALAASRTGREAEQARADAARSFQRYLTGGGTASPFAESARRELERLSPARGRPAPP